MRPLGHPPPPVLRPCRRPLQLLDQPCFLRLEASLCSPSFPSCCCWQLLLHIISESMFLVFLAVASLPPCCPPSHPCSVAHTTTKRGRSLFSWLRSQMTLLSLSLPFHTSFTFFLDLWLWLMHSLLFLPLQQQLACSAGSLSRPPVCLISLLHLSESQSAFHSSD